MNGKRKFLIALEPVEGQAGRWYSGALGLPQARVMSVRTNLGELVHFAPDDQGIAIVGTTANQLEAHIEVASDLLSQEDIERQKLEYEERGRRNTFLWSIGSGLLTAAVTLGVAWVNKPAVQHGKQTSAPPSFADLDQCRDSLERLSTLASNEDQILEDIRKLVRSHDEACRDRLEAALASLRR